MKWSDMSVAMKTTLARNNSEMEKLEKSKRAHLRMLNSSEAKLKLKQGVTEDVMKPFGDVEAKNIKMYETHVPGFCYLRNGERRKRTTSTVLSTNPDPVQCSEKVKAILFTDNELDVYKTMCLHLLGTHVQTRAHIQRKDGRLCSYVKAQTMGNTPHTLQSYSQRPGVNVSKVVSRYDKMLPRYILDVRVWGRGISNPSMKSCDFESGSDDEAKKKRKVQVPVYINSEIRMIIQSVMEALEAVNSSKLKELICLASSPEELRNMLKNEDLHDFLIELSTNPLVVKPTSYDFVVTHLMFDKIPEKGTLESVAQVLEIYDNADLHRSISQIQKAIYQRHKQLIDSNIIPKTKSGLQVEDKSVVETPKTQTPSTTASSKAFQVSNTSVSAKKDPKEDNQARAKDVKNVQQISNQRTAETPPECSRKSNPTGQTSSSKNVTINLENVTTEDNRQGRDETEYETYVDEEGQGSAPHSRSGSIDSNKYSFQNLSNSQRILFGLKVASLKCKPINMHQFEGKKKIDFAAILAPILRAQDSDLDLRQLSLQNQVSPFTVPDRKLRKSSSNISEIHTSDLENLTRALLTNLRLEISESENRKRVSQFVATLT